MNAMTASHLRSAFGGESMAHMRYKIWAKKAEEQGFKSVARLFRAVSFAEEIHAGNHFKELMKAPGGFEVLAGAGFGNESTAENLAGAIEGEAFEVREMYPAYIEVAKLQGEKTAQRSLEWAMVAEKVHLEMYKKAKQAVDAGKDADFGQIQVCENCGHTVEGGAPDKCPVCGVPKKMFREFA